MAYRDARLLAGQLPLWAPDYFVGAPFLANPQTGVLYPPNWLTLWLAPPRAYAWQLVGHTLLGAAGAFWCARRVLRVGALGGFAAALVAAFGGFAQSMVGHVNQLQAAAWLPWAVLLAETAWRARSRRAAAGLGVVLALQVLAGHAQQSYMTAAFLGAWLLGRSLSRWEKVKIHLAPGAPASAALPGAVQPRPNLVPLGKEVVGAVFVLAVGGGLAGLLAAPQLLPMQELTARGIRAGGMTFREAAAFSLPPWVLPSSLLPVFSSAGQPNSEWLGYVGVVGLVLAGLGAVGGHRRAEALMLAVIAAGALLLALGQIGPLYPLAYRLVPGVGLFRVPARWLFVWSFALALLAAIGADLLSRAACDRTHLDADGRVDLRPLARLAVLLGVPTALAAAYWLVGHGPVLRLPELPILLLWLALALIGSALAALALGGWRFAPPALVGVLAVELVAASWPLDVNRVGPADAYEAFRPIEAHLLERIANTPGGPYRTLAITDSSFDPGDLPLLRSEVAGVIEPDRVADWVAVVKHKDTLTPNLPVRFGIPSIDGYDGGLLPLRGYLALKELFPLTAANLTDGRLGIQLDRLPSADLLSWLNVRWVVMDRHRDVWIDGIYYDRAVETRVSTGEAITLDGIPATTRASAVGMWLAPLAAVEPGAPIGELDVAARDGASRTVALTAGPSGAAPGAPQLVRVGLGGTIAAARAVLRAPAPSPGLRLDGLTLIDEASGVDWPVPAAPGLRFSALGDVKVYENARALPRAFVVHGVQPVAGDEEARALIATGALDPTAAVAIVGATADDAAGRAPGPAAAEESVEIASYAPERVELRARLATAGALVLTDADYPGWSATVDGAPAPIRRADVGVRAILLDAGEHRVVFTYRSPLLLYGAGLAAIGALLALALLLWPPRR
jgi:hypothetical protein